MSLLIALILAVAPQEDPTLTEMPEGWNTGKKSGWDGDFPPDWEKKSDEDKKKFLELWNNAKFRYIKFMMGAKGHPTGAVTAVLFMLKAVNAGVHPNQSAELAMFGQQHKLKEGDFKLMMKGASSVYGTDVKQADAVAITKDLVTTGLRGTALEQRIRAEISRKHKLIQEEKAKKEKEEKDKEKEGDKKEPGKN
jgi:hypothetical protein